MHKKDVLLKVPMLLLKTQFKLENIMYTVLGF
jgi:hypothetical protein